MIRVHIIGAGLAGLAAAVKLAKSGVALSLYEGAGQAGGRCRSFYDDQLKARIDNGNHLILTGNYSVGEYIKTIGAGARFDIPEAAVFPFLDLATGERWQVMPTKGRIPLWLFNKKRSIPGAGWSEYFRVFKLYTAGEKKTVTDCVGNRGALVERFWDPLTLAALNTPAEEASARLLRAVLSETFFKGGTFCRPMVAKEGLTESLIDPAVTYLKERGAEFHFNTRLTRLAGTGKTLKALVFGKRTVALDPARDRIIFALAPAIVQQFFPDIAAPDAYHPIANVHFKLPAKGKGFGDVPFLGLLNGTAHWLFIRNNIASVTVSAADELADLDASDIARVIWRDVAAALAMDARTVPPNRVIREKRATFSQTPAQAAKRAPTRGPVTGLYLAGDWTDTGIPATIESAVRSGFTAARLVAEDCRFKL